MRINFSDNVKHFVYHKETKEITILYECDKEKLQKEQADRIKECVKRAENEYTSSGVLKWTPSTVALQRSLCVNTNGYGYGGLLSKNDVPWEKSIKKNFYATKFLGITVSRDKVVIDDPYKDQSNCVFIRKDESPWNDLGNSAMMFR